MRSIIPTGGPDRPISRQDRAVAAWPRGRAPNHLGSVLQVLRGRNSVGPAPRMLRRAFSALSASAVRRLARQPCLSLGTRPTFPSSVQPVRTQLLSSPFIATAFLSSASTTAVTALPLRAMSMATRSRPASSSSSTSSSSTSSSVASPALPLQERGRRTRSSAASTTAAAAVAAAPAGLALAEMPLVLPAPKRTRKSAAAATSPAAAAAAASPRRFNRSPARPAGQDPARRTHQPVRPAAFAEPDTHPFLPALWDRLYSERSPAVAEHICRYMRDLFPYLGLTVPHCRRLWCAPLVHSSLLPSHGRCLLP